MSAQAYRLKPWNEVLRPHDDILEGRLEMSTYAADIGAVDREDPNVPRVYRDPAEFFRTTYFTQNLGRLLTDSMRAIRGGAGDRVIQLRTPFGGGKTHALLALLHLVRSRDAIDPALVDDFPDPGPGKVAVLSGIDLDPNTPRQVEDQTIHTLWGELAYRLGGETAYEKVRVHDERGSSPAGNVLRPLIGSRPVLILLDEVLVYVERAGGKSGDNPLRRQVMMFLQGLTEVVRGLPNAVLVYSLQASVHEAAGDEALLQELDHLVTRVDAKREPVSDDEVMRVVQRRLFPSFGDDPTHESVAQQVAREYAISYRKLKEGFAETESERRAAGHEAERFDQRVLQSYPFHPELLDLMYHRWGSLPSYQRTRGALQFLARVVHALWNGARTPQPLIGPGDVPLEDEHVRGAFFSQVGQREQYTSVLSRDISGAEARSREVDRRIAADAAVYEQMRVGTACSSAIMLYSFGGREDEDRGVLESELLQALVTPDLDRNVLTTALHDLREELLYLHYTGRRYRFEPKANLNLMISEEAKKWGTDEVVDRVKAELAEALKTAGDAALLWPPDSAAISDGEPLFRVVYLGPEYASMATAEVDSSIREMVQKRGNARREYCNALAFALPGRQSLDRARSTARLVLALDALLSQVRSKRLKLDKEQTDEVNERRRGAVADLVGAIDRLYEQVRIPVASRSSDEPFALEAIDLRAQLAAGRDLQTRILDALRKHVFDSITPTRLASLAKLGEVRDFISTQELVAWFFSYYDFPKLRDESAIRSAIARGASDVLGYVPTSRVEDGTLVPSRPDLVRYRASLREDEVDLGPGCYVLAPRLAAQLLVEPDAEEDEGTPVVPEVAEPDESTETEDASAAPDVGARRYRIAFGATAEQLFRVFPALQNLADRASTFHARIEVAAESDEGFDLGWLRNAVEEQLDEAGVDGEAGLE